MPRKIIGSAIESGTITVTQISGGLNDTTNASYLQANTARTTANDSYAQANASRDQANTARTQANTAYDQANSARGQANTAYGQGNSAYGQANAAYGQANAAYSAANTRLLASGGTLSGDLIITGNLTVSGNQTILNTEVLTTEDAEIILLSNTAGTPALNAGLIINRGTSTNTFLRWNEATDKWGYSDDGTTFYSLDDMRSGLVTHNTTFGTTNTTFGTTNTTFGTVNTNATNINSNAINAYAQANTARTTANDAYGQANTARNTANSAYGAANTAQTTAQNAYGQANTATTNAGNAYNAANNASTASSRLISDDNRTIAPNTHTAGRLTFGFTSFTNNGNASTYADYLHFRSYTDSSGGSDNLVMFHKSGIGMRIWQQTWNSANAYSSYVDVLHSSNYSSYALPISGGTISGNVVMGSSSNQFIRYRTASNWDYYLSAVNDDFSIYDSNSTLFFKAFYNGGSTGKYLSLLSTLYVKNDETVGISIASPSGKLHVYNSSGFTMVLEKPSGASLQFKNSGGNGYQIDDNSGSMRWYSGGSTLRMTLGTTGNLTPGTDNNQDFGSSSLRWANIYTADLNLSNRDSSNDIDGTWGEWTIQEGETKLYLINRRNGKKYSFVLSEEE